MKTAKRLYEENKKKGVEAIYSRKCTVCGLYGRKDEINLCENINGDVYSDICNNCSDALKNGVSIKKIHFNPDIVEDFF